MMYTKKVLDIFYNPKNVGEMRDASGIGKVGNPKCGDIMKMYLKIENNIIVDAKFQTFGCTAAIASTSVATEMIIGKTLEEAEKLTNADVLKELGELPPAKIHCSVLAEEAIKSAIENFRKKHFDGRSKLSKQKKSTAKKSEISPKIEEIEQDSESAYTIKKIISVEKTGEGPEKKNEQDVDISIDSLDEIDEITNKISKAVNKLKK